MLPFFTKGIVPREASIQPGFLYPDLILQLWFSSGCPPTPLLIHPQPHRYKKKKKGLRRPTYIFQELYWACELDLDCVTNLVAWSVLQEVTAYG